MKKQLALLLASLFLFTSCVKGRASNAPPAGRIEENTYTATYIGLQFTADENWYLTSERELAQTTAYDLRDGTILDMEAIYPHAETSSDIRIYYMPKVKNDLSFDTALDYLAYSRNDNIAIQMTLDSVYENTEITDYVLADMDFVYYETYIPSMQVTEYYFAKDADENYILLIYICIPSDIPLSQVTDLFTALQ